MNKNGIPMTDSKMVACVFSKVHRNVIRDIKKIIDSSGDFGLLNFELSTYKSSQNKMLPCYLMTKDGFTLLAMGYGTEKAIKFKIGYIDQFNEMEKVLGDSISLSKQIDKAMLSYSKDKSTASYCGTGLSLWKKKRDDHLDKINKLKEGYQIKLDLL